MATLKQATKQAPKTNAKQATKAPSKTQGKTQGKAQGKAPAAVKEEPKTLTQMIVDGITQRLGSPFYKTAMAYHAKKGTAFPRPRNDMARASLKEADVTEVFRQHDARVLASGNSKAQAMFDVYMMHAK